MKRCTKPATALAAVLAGATGLLAVAAAAFACIPIAVLNLTPSEVAPGGTVTALIREISGSEVPPVTFHWQTVDGPVLATAQPGDSSTTASFQVPPGTPGGDYIVWATQPQMVYPKGQFPTWGMPAKASLHVVTPTAPPALFGGDAAIQTQTRSPGLVANSRSGLSAGAIVAIVVVTMILALAVVAVIARASSRRSPQAAAAGGP